MALTVEERLTQLETMVTQIMDILETLPATYTSKLQWKQLDNVRSAEIDERLIAIEALLTSVDNRLKIVEQS